MHSAAAMKSRLRGPVTVLYGGCSAEREVSLKSGAAVAAALGNRGIEVRLLDATGDWLARLAADGTRHCFVALHGGAGENGEVQGALATQGIGYTGSGVLACALAMDKQRCKYLWLGMGLPTPAWRQLAPGMDWNAVLAELGGKVMVKPASEGSSVGMSSADDATSLARAYAEAVQYDPVVIAEQWIHGPEYTVALVGDLRLPAIRLQPAGEFYDYEAKYLSDLTQYHCPCGLSPQEEEQLQALARSAFASVGGTGWGRVDFMAADGRFYLLEVNTVPGMTDHSLVPMAAAAAGIGFDQLVLEILAASLPAGGGNG